jgi:hypothetical protein
LALAQFQLIEVEHYNDLALTINRLYSDTTTSLGYYTSNVLTTDTAPFGGYGIGQTWSFSDTLLGLEDFVVVTVDDITLINGSDYVVETAGGSNNQVRTLVSINPGSVIVIYNRQEHRYGWGQPSSVYPITAGDPVLADEETLQAYIDANVNNLIDKTNIMTERVGSVVSLTRVAGGNLILASDKLTIIDTINNEIDTGTAYWNNEVATATPSVTSFTRTTDWNTQLVGVFRFTWADYDSMRYYFNSGCDLRCSLEMTGDDQDAGYYNWNQVVTRMGTLILNYETASQTGTGGVTNNVGAFELTTAYQPIFTSGSPITPVTGDGPSPGVPGDYTAYGEYDTLVALFEARLSVDTPAAGNVSIDIRVVMDDSSFLVQDISGTTTFNAGYRVADDDVNNSATFSMTPNVPVISTLEDFDSGNDS